MPDTGVTVMRSPAELARKASPSSPATPRVSDAAVRAYDRLKGMAENYEFKPGARINEIDVSRELNLSRTPVRQALARLASDGFIAQTPNRGYYVRPISIRDVQDLYETRATLETGGFVLACQRGSLDDIDKVAEAWESRIADKSIAIAELVDADEAFHIDVMRLSSNSRLVEALQRINSLVRFFRRIDLETRRDDTFVEHAEIIACLRARDHERGREILMHHFSIGSEHVVNVTRESLARIFLNAEEAR